MLTLESFEQAAEISKTGNSGDKTDQKQLFFRSHGKQSISEARKHAAYRSL